MRLRTNVVLGLAIAACLGGRAAAVSYNWQGPNNGLWTDPANWNDSTPGAGVVAVFSDSAAAGQTVELGNTGDIAVGSLTFNGAVTPGNTIASSSGAKLILTNTAPALTVSGGANVISAPLDGLTNNTTITAAAGASLTLSGPVTVAGTATGDMNLVKNGLGVWNVTGTPSQPAQLFNQVGDACNKIVNISQGAANFTDAVIYANLLQPGLGGTAYVTATNSALYGTNNPGWGYGGMQIGRGGGFTSYSMVGGTLDLTGSSYGLLTLWSGNGKAVASFGGGAAVTAPFLYMGDGDGSTAVVTIRDATVTLGEDGIYAGASKGFCIINQLGGTLNNAGPISLVYRMNQANCWGIYNLTGTASASEITCGDNTVNFTGNRAYFNFHGGTLKPTQLSANFVKSTLTGASAGHVSAPQLMVYAEGATIDTAYNVTINEPLAAPPGQGVSGGTLTIPLADQGSGYRGEPMVRLLNAGGDTTGAAATAVANMIDDGTGKGTFKIASITITNPGVNYTAAPAFSISGGDPTTPAAVPAPVIAANVSGGFTKRGEGRLTLGAANTYAGPTQIDQGTLALAAAGSIPNTPTITVAAGARLDVSELSEYHLLGGQTLRGGAADAAGTVNGVVLADAGSTVAPGTPAAAGTLSLPSGLTLAGGGTLAFRLGTTAGDLIDLGASALNASGTTTINLTDGGLTGPGTFTLIGNIVGGTWSKSAFSIASTPADYTATLDDSTGASLRVVLTGGTNQWKGPGGGDWNAAGNWTAAVPNGNTATARLWAGITANAAVDLKNTDQTVKTLSFKRGTPSGNYTLQASGSGKLHLAADAGSAAIEVQSGTHSITAPVALDSNTDVVVSNASDALTLGGTVSGTGSLTLTAGNAGKVILGGANFTTGYSGGTTVNAGTLQLDSADALRGGSNLTLTGAAKATLGGTSTVNLGSAVKLADLNLNTHATSGLTATLDVNKSKLVADKTQVSVATVRAQIKSAYAAARWTGSGITSAAAAADYAASAAAAKTAVGYLDNAISVAQGGGKTTWSGRSVDSNSVLVRYTYYGDCNLDGQVNLADFGIFKLNFGTGSQWYQGDFDYSGAVNLADFGKLKQAFGSPAIAAAAVPEPGAGAMLFVFVPWWLTRRCFHHKGTKTRRAA